MFERGERDGDASLKRGGGEVHVCGGWVQGSSVYPVPDRYLRFLDSKAQVEGWEFLIFEADKGEQGIGRFETLTKRQFDIKDGSFGCSTEERSMSRYVLLLVN